MNNLDRAREWAEKYQRHHVIGPEDEVAAVEVIQSLPDQIVDGCRLRQIIDFQGTGISDDARKDLESLITPSLPTLAELIEAGNDPKQYQWMQCNVEGRGDDIFVIAVVGERINKVLLPDGLHEVKGNNQVTPLPDLPKLEWPSLSLSGESEAVSVETEESSLPRPEDVPAGEPWIVRYEREEWVGVRANADRVPWHIISMDGLDCRDVEDSDITLMPRLVQEDKP